MLNSKNQEMQKILSLPVIPHYVHYLQLNEKISSRCKVMYGCECCISAKRILLSLLSWRDPYLKKLKDQSQNNQNRRSGVKSSGIYETYKI